MLVNDHNYVTPSKATTFLMSPWDEKLCREGLVTIYYHCTSSIALAAISCFKHFYYIPLHFMKWYIFLFLQFFIKFWSQSPCTMLMRNKTTLIVTTPMHVCESQILCVVSVNDRNGERIMHTGILGGFVLKSPPTDVPVTP